MNGKGRLPSDPRPSTQIAKMISERGDDVSRRGRLLAALAGELGSPSLYVASVRWLAHERRRAGARRVA